MLSNLVESSISNFENEESVEDGATGAGEIDAAVNQKSQIRIERQASISQNHKIYKNLKSRKSRKDGKRKNEPSIQVANLHDDKAEKSSTNNRKDIDSDNKSDISEDSNGAKIRAHGKRSSLLGNNRAKKPAPGRDQSKGGATPGAAGNEEEQHNSQVGIEIRGVETIEEFFRPEFAQNT